MARVLFPRTCVNQRFESFNGVNHLWVQPDKITIAVLERFVHPLGPEIIYDLSSTLQLKHVDVTSAFRTVHAELFATGQLDHAFSDNEAAALRAIHHARQ